MKRKFHEVKTTSLLGLAGIIWLIAGINVTKLGIESYRSLYNTPMYLYGLSIVIFILFGQMFYKMSKKHRVRINGYEESYKPFYYFFDLKSYLIMAVMMGGGIYIRNAHLMPDAFIAFFYTGLGIALGLAGVLFINYYMKDR